MRRPIITLAVGALIVVTLTAQDAPLVFDAVSIKPNLSGAGGSGMTSRPGGFEATNVSLRALILNAFDVQEFQVVGGPDWVASDRFDVTARGEGDGGARGSRMQAMLADRFKLVTHTETRERPIYALVPARADRRLGPAMTPALVDCSGGNDPARQRREAGAPSCGLTTNTGRRGGTVRGGGLTMAKIATMLANYGAERPVIDRSGIEGIFDLELKWVNEPTGNAEEVSFFTAVQEQLGLKLEPAMAPGEVMVIDRAEKPDPN
jgi:uncharacterized protein (TIGR03435 family)